MAEGLWRDLCEGEWESFSAGTPPTGEVHPLAVKTMEEIGIDIARHRSKHFEEFSGRRFDLAITVCSGAAEECPWHPGAANTLHWPLRDPASACGTDEERMPSFRQVRDAIRDRITSYIEP